MMLHQTKFAKTKRLEKNAPEQMHVDAFECKVPVLHSGRGTNFESFGCIQKNQSEHFGTCARDVSRCEARPILGVALKKKAARARCDTQSKLFVVCCLLFVVCCSLRWGVATRFFGVFPHWENDFARFSCHKNNSDGAGWGGDDTARVSCHLTWFSFAFSHMRMGWGWVGWGWYYTCLAVRRLNFS